MAPIRTTLLACVLLLATAGTALADPTVRMDGSTLEVDGTAGRDDIELNAVTGELRIRNAQGIGRTIEPGAGCRRVSDTVVGCPRSGTSRGRVTLGLSDDRLTVRSGAADLPLTVHGGDNDDSILGSNAGDSLFGNDGNDVLSGAGGNDAIDGGAAEDSLAGGPGDDVLDGASDDDALGGGTGSDTVDYSARTQRVVVTLDDVADDGTVLTAPLPNGEFIDVSQPEKDNVRSDVENILGSSDRDSLVGNASANRVNGLSGDDRIRTLDGDDHVIGGNGFDTMDGGLGTDLLDFSDQETMDKGEASFFERFILSRGDDRFRGDRFTVEIDGGLGDDVLFSEEPNGGSPQRGPTTYRGGPGVDMVSYLGDEQPLSISVDGLANDGRAGEGDDVGPDVEQLEGGVVGDVLRGTSGNEVLKGSHGDDRIEGGGGDDVLFGSVGTDRLDGGTGLDIVSYEDTFSPVRVTLDGRHDDGPADENDQLVGVEGVRGGSGDDEIIGNDGPNRLDGGRGSDQISGLGGEDVVSSVDGVTDRVSCGAGSDFARVDLVDAPAGVPDCETSVRGARDQHPMLRIERVRLRRGVLRLRLRCPAKARPETCRGRLTVRRGDRTVRARRYRVRRGGAKRIVIKGARRGRHELEAVGTDAQGRPLTTLVRVRL